MPLVDTLTTNQFERVAALANRASTVAPIVRRVIVGSFVIVILRGRRMRPHMRRTAGSDDGAAKRPQNENGSYTDVAVYEPCIAKRVCRGVCVTP